MGDHSVLWMAQSVCLLNDRLEPACSRRTLKAAGLADKKAGAAKPAVPTEMAGARHGSGPRALLCLASDPPLRNTEFALMFSSVLQPSVSNLLLSPESKASYLPASCRLHKIVQSRSRLFSCMQLSLRLILPSYRTASLASF